MDDIVISADLGKASLKKEAFRDGLEQFHARCSSLLYLSLQWKDLDDHYNGVHEALERKSEELRLRERSLGEIYLDVVAKQEGFLIMEEMIEDRCKELDLQADGLVEKHRLAIEEKGREIEKVIERRLENLEAKEKSFELKNLLVQKLIDERFKVIEEKERQFARIEKEVRRQSEQLEEKSRGLEAERANLRERVCEVKLREERHEEKLKEVELMNEKADAKLRDLDLKSKELEVRSRELESERKRFDLDCENLHEQLKAVELKEKQVEDGAKELGLKNKKLDEKIDDLELDMRLLETKRLRLDDRLGELEADKRKFESERKRFDLDCENLHEQLKAVELKEKQVEDRAKELGLKNKKLDEKIDDLELDMRLLEANRLRLDDRLGELEADKRKFESEKKKFDIRVGEVVSLDEETNKRARDLELRKKQLEVGLEELELNRGIFEAERYKLNERQAEIESNKIVFDSDREKFDESLRELDMKTKQLERQCEELKSIRKGFEEQEEKLKLSEKKMEECSKDFELKLKQWEEKFLGIQNSRVRGCVAVDGKNLQVLLNECGKNDLEKMGDEVLFFLKISEDPARVVLDGMQGFFPPHLKHGEVEFKGRIVRANCILLLEQLLKISPDIKQEVKSEATKLSFDWMTKLKPDHEHSFHILGFLLLVANFKLRQAFDDNELLNYAKVIAHWRQVPELCRLIGFKDEIPGFIQDLLARKKHLAAIRFASTFDLLSDFPPDPIMVEFMEISRGAFKTTFHDKNSSLKAQSQATKKRINDLRSAIRCIEDHKLKLGYHPENIRQAIASLEQQLADRRKEVAVVGEGLNFQGGQDENDTAHGSLWISPPSSTPVSVNCSVAEKAAAIASSDMSLQQKQTIMHSLTATSQQAVPSAPVDSDNYFQSLGLESNQQLCLSTHQDHLPKGNSIEDVISTLQKDGNTEPQKSPSMDGESLISLLRGDAEKLVHNASTIFKSSSKPEDLVLYVFEDIRPSPDMGILLNGSISLLKELKTVSFNLDPQLHARAKEISKIYESWLRTAKNNLMGVICLLQFLDAYKVPHDADDVISLLDPSIWQKEVLDSCELLGLQRFIPDFLGSLCQKNQKINAVKYIHAMELESTFPVDAILKNHLAHWENKADILLKKQNGTLLAQIKALDMKIKAAKEMIECISISKLPSAELMKDVGEFIKNAEKQRSEILLNLDSNETKPLVGSKRTAPECSQPQVEEPSSTVASVTKYSNLKKKRQTKFLATSDPSFVPPPPPRPLKKPRLHNKMLDSFKGPYCRDRNRGQFVYPSHDDEQHCPTYLTDLTSNGCF
ncbi:hypothetical protein SAY87_003503 [Trapa incisa]|uniref:FRIGIDA-like protein n=1 Tax=Trapa incisa TaxID=236973 RepID=A0AAN7QHS9_9MYRT|nr:hypothetical protein SAY87_003503 [Trapa incisa]